MLAFVEGSMERQFININFKYVRVIPVQNGISWPVNQICRRIVSSYKAFGSKTEVIVWIDREGREDSAKSIRNCVIESLKMAGLAENEIHVMINDRMSENIILSDEMLMARTIKNDNYNYRFEGTNGKSNLKIILKEIGINYKEMIHGVKLLKEIRLTRAAEKSECVKDFLSTFSRDCWWVNGKN